MSSSSLSSPDPNVSRPTHTLHTRPSTVIKPLPFFHPTRARFHTLDAPEDSTPAGEWSSRPSRKNRIIPQSIQAFHEEDGGEKGGPNSIEARMWHAKGQLKPHLSWDIAFWSAFAFVIGSIAWVRIFYIFQGTSPAHPHDARLSTVFFSSFPSSVPALQNRMEIKLKDGHLSAELSSKLERI
jgi:hypothetical protein